MAFPEKLNPAVDLFIATFSYEESIQSIFNKRKCPLDLYGQFAEVILSMFCVEDPGRNLDNARQTGETRSSTCRACVFPTVVPELSWLLCNLHYRSPEEYLFNRRRDSGEHIDLYLLMRRSYITIYI